MKTNVLMKIAVVFMAAFGAYAFSGNANSQSSLFIHKDDLCRNIEQVCDFNGEFSCKIVTSDLATYQVWSDLMCSVEARHSDSTPIPFNPKL